MASETTIPRLFLHRVASTPEAEAFSFPSASGWRTMTWRETYANVREIALALRTLGLRDEDRCAILCSTRIEWLLIDLAILCAGGATTTIYRAATSDECAFIIEDSTCVFVFAEDAEQVEKLRRERKRTPSIRKVIAINGSVATDDWVISFDQLRAKGQRHGGDPDDELEAQCLKPRGNSLATLIYTSGTTGRPKGVRLTHDCWIYEAEAIDALGILSDADVQYLWLPLAHSFGKVLEVAQLRIGFKTAVDGRVTELVRNLETVRPTFVAAVPRIFEKVRAKVIDSASSGGRLRRAVFDWSFSIGRRVSALRQRRHRVPPSLAFCNLVADRLVFSKLRQRFGGRLRFFISGSAPLSRELGEFFHAAGILVLEGYGLTETSAATFVNRPDQFAFGAVGPPVPGTEVRISPDDGEILLRGRGMTPGYHNLPEATAELIDDDGWLHTGDIGTFEDGFLRITDRKKDLIKTSGGKYVAPQMVEARLKLHCPYISQAVVHGNNRKYCTALIALDEEAIRPWAERQGLGHLGYPELSKHPQVRDLVGRCVDAVNATLARYETIKSFSLLPEDISLESGGLTPSLKLKRKAVEKRYASLLDALYESSSG